MRRWWQRALEKAQWSPTSGADTLKRLAHPFAFLRNPMSDNAPPQDPGSAAPHDNAPQAPLTEAEQLSQVQAELAVLQAKSADLADQFLRAKADAENARRRAEEEVSKARKFALESFAESLLPVADSLEAGLAIKDATVQQINEGAQATLRQLVAALERNKVIAINPAAGAKFDPPPPPGHQRGALGAGGQQRGHRAAKRLFDCRARDSSRTGDGVRAQIRQFVARRGLNPRRAPLIACYPIF